MATAGTMAIDIDCKHCEAKRGSPCTDLSHRNGRMIGRFHHSRVEDAAAVTRTENALDRARARTEEQP